jgi:site-specific DNA-adenine methylase
MRSLFPYPGGKFFLMKDIKEIFEKSGKTTAVDVFGGSGKFLLNVNAKIKVYNDLDSRLVNLYLVLRERHQERDRRHGGMVHVHGEGKHKEETAEDTQGRCA